MGATLVHLHICDQDLLGDRTPLYDSSIYNLVFCQHTTTHSPTSKIPQEPESPQSCAYYGICNMWYTMTQQAQHASYCQQAPCVHECLTLAGMSSVSSCKGTIMSFPCDVTVKALPDNPEQQL